MAKLLFKYEGFVGKDDQYALIGTRQDMEILMCLVGRTRKDVPIESVFNALASELKERKYEVTNTLEAIVVERIKE